MFIVGDVSRFDSNFLDIKPKSVVNANVESLRRKCSPTAFSPTSKTLYQFLKLLEVVRSLCMYSSSFPHRIQLLRRTQKVPTL